MSIRLILLGIFFGLAAQHGRAADAVATDASDDSSGRRPNVIYIMADDLGFGDLGCYGQKRIQTPTLDRMASEGLKFNHHYAGHTVCRPSRLTLWMGQHVGSTGIIGNVQKSLSGSQSTVAKLLQQSGYATGGVGKWSLGNVDTPDQIDNPGHPNRNGFDRWLGYMNQSNAHNFYPTFLWDNDRQVPLPGNVLMDDPQARGRVAKQRETYSHDVMTDAAFDFIRRHQNDPFLLHIHWTIPHANNEGGRVTGDGMEVPEYGVYAKYGWPMPEKGFAAMITRMDRDIGRLLELLSELAIDEHTLVLFTSDNGPHHEGGHKDTFFRSAGPLQGSKRSMHEGGIRVPLIARWPGKIAAGTTTDHPSAFWDFLPTACEIAGVDPPADIDGISYLPTLLGKPDQQVAHDYLFWASSEGDTSIGVRCGPWKLIKYPEGRNIKGASLSQLARAPGTWRLFHVIDDPGERTDLSVQNSEVVDEIRSLLRRDGLLAGPSGQ